MKRVEAFAPGRVNIIGEHTDYTGGLVLPVALDVGLRVTGERGGDQIILSSETEPDRVVLGLDGAAIDASGPVPGWGAYVAEVVRQLRPSQGFVGSVSTTMPTGGTGLSSSSALACSLLLAFGAEGDPIEIAKMAQRAEVAATGVEVGLMDQIASMCGIAQHAIRIDCRSFDVDAVPVPDDIDILVVHSGQPRLLVDSEYSDRREACYAAEAEIGPLRDATLGDITQLNDPVLRKRAEHVISENARVEMVIAAMKAGDIAAIAEHLNEGHRSLSELFETSTPIVDAMAAQLRDIPGVLAARMTGGGFGGCLVAISEPGVQLDIPNWWMRAEPGPGAALV